MSVPMTPTAAPLPALQGIQARPEPVSIAGIVLLSAMAVLLTILGVLLLGATLVAAWWLFSHIPVPAFVWHALARLQAAL